MTDTDADDADDAFACDLQVRFRDLDPMGHVNNAIYVTYLEQARAEYFEAVIGESLRDVPTVLVTVTIDYRAEITLGDPVTVRLSVGDLGRSSIPMVYEIRAGGDLAATAETVQVVVDESGDSRSIPEEWRDRIRSRRTDD